MKKICLIIIIILQLILFKNISADELGLYEFAEEFEKITIEMNIPQNTKIEAELTIEMKINVFYNQFKNNIEPEIKIDAIQNAAQLGEQSKMFFEYVMASAETPYKIETLKIINKNKFKFDELILKALDDSDDTVVIRAIECSINLDKTAQQEIIEKSFTLKKNIARGHLLPILFSDPEYYKNYIRRILLSEDLDLKFAGYKYLINQAPKMFELVCLGMFDEDVEINRFVLSKYKLYRDNGKQLIYYGLKSDRKTVVEYAKTLLKEIRD